MNTKNVYKDWLARTRDKRLMQVTNIRNKIPSYAGLLPFPQDKTEQLILVCDSYIALTNYVLQAKATAKQLTKYELMMNTAAGGKRNSPAPLFRGTKPLELPNGSFVGLIPALRELVDDIKHAENYTPHVGRDLMILAKGEELNERNIFDSIKMSPVARTYKIRVSGNLYGIDAIRFDWQKKGTDAWQTGVRFLTKLPGEIEIEPTTSDEPEAGSLRYVLIDKNEIIGEFSPIYSFVLG